MKTYDVVIVGSGAAGGTLAAHLARAGVDVAVVEGGPKINTRADFNTHAMPWEFANRQIPRMKPGKDGMASERARGLGGKSLTWNAVAWRQSQRDFKGKSIDGAADAAVDQCHDFLGLDHLARVHALPVADQVVAFPDQRGAGSLRDLQAGEQGIADHVLGMGHG